jgi:hypothetical protein
MLGCKMLKTLLHHQKTDMVINKEWLLTLREEYKLRVLRRIFGPKKDKVTREWRKLCNEELNDLYSSPNIVRIIKLRRIRWVGRRGEAYTGLWKGKLRERDYFEDPGIGGRIILRWIFRKWDVGIWAGLGQGQVVGTCECDNEPSGSIICGEFLD